MLNEKFHEVISHQGIVSITSWANNGAHVVNTWNSYLVIKDGNKILIPAAGMRHTEKNIVINPTVKITLGSPEVMGHRFMGTGYLIEGTAAFLTQGADFDRMKAKYPFLTRVLEVTATSCIQTL